MQSGLALEAVLSALGDPIRRGIVQRLAAGPATAGQLGDPYDVSQPAIARHLRVLREADLVQVTSSGRNSWYELSTEPLLDVRSWLQDLIDRWSVAPRLQIELEPEKETS